jgi:hypothetical protein
MPQKTFPPMRKKHCLQIKQAAAQTCKHAIPSLTSQTAPSVIATTLTDEGNAASQQISQKWTRYLSAIPAGPL